MEALWKSILDITSQFVIPDWGALIGLLPVFLAILVIAWFAWTIRRFATAGPTRRAPARLTPVTPADIHMPGPSLAPILAAFGAASLFWGLVVGGTAMLVGATILVLTLLWWGREAIRDYDRAEPSETLPAVVHPGPPEGVHMPGPSFRPLLGALGAAALMLGLVYGGWLLAAGAIVLVVTLVGWLVDAKAEYAKTEEADATGHLENIPAPRWPSRLLQAIAVVIVVAGLVQFGVIPPKSGAAGGGETPGASGAPSGAPGGGNAITAKDIAYDKKSLEVKAGEPFTIEFRNADPAGVVHDVDIRAKDAKTVVVDQKTTDGGQTATYQYKALDPGEYVFICSIHPIPSMTGTLIVK
jgi:plastocyanin